MTSQPPLRQAAELRSGDHVCSVFHSDGKRFRVLSAFVQAGLDCNERVLCFTDEEGPADILNALREQGVDTEGYVQRKQLVVGRAQESYLSTGRFDPDAVVKGWETAVRDALAGGFSGLRVAGNLGWVTRGVPGGEHLLAYERRLRREVFARYPVIGMCEFDMRVFDAAWLEDIWVLHPAGVVGSAAASA